MLSPGEPGTAPRRQTFRNPQGTAASGGARGMGSARATAAGSGACPGPGRRGPRSPVTIPSQAVQAGAPKAHYREARAPAPARGRPAPIPARSRPPTSGSGPPPPAPRRRSFPSRSLAAAALQARQPRAAAQPPREAREPRLPPGRMRAPPVPRMRGEPLAGVGVRARSQVRYTRF